MKKREIVILILALVIFALGYLYVSKYRQNDVGNYLVVVHDGVEIDRKSLFDEGIYDINLDGDYSNKYKIDDGVVTMIEANCRDGLCVKMKSISKNGEMIICLPHKLYLKIQSEKETNLDGVSR